jgi:hypothetical protein
VLLDVYEKALSEHLFIPVTLLFALVLEELMRRPRAASWFAAGVLCVWASFFLRYIGIVFAVTGALVIVVAEWRRHRAGGLVRGAVFGALAVSAPLAWAIRNVDRGSGAFGHRASSSAGVITNVSRAGKPVASWIVTDAGPAAVRALVIVGVLAFVAILALLAASSTSSASKEPVEWRPLVPLALLVVVYVVYLTTSASIVAFGAISNTRFMVPVYVPVVVLGAWAFEQLRDRLDTASLRRVANVAAIAFVGVNVVWFAARATDAERHGAGGYATARYHESELLSEVRHLDTSIPAFSNDTPAIALFTGRTVKPSVAKTYFHSDDETGKLGDFVREVSCRKRVLLIWFTPNPRPYLYTPLQLRTRVSLRAIVTRNDGTIYELRPLAATAGSCR